MQIDANGLRDYILDHGWVSEFSTENYSSPNDYCLLCNDDLNEIDEEMQNQIVQLRFAGKYDKQAKLQILHFSSYHFDNLEYLHIGNYGLQECREIVFSGKNCLDPFFLPFFSLINTVMILDLPKLRRILIGEKGFQLFHHVIFKGKYSSLKCWKNNRTHFVID